MPMPPKLGVAESCHRSAEGTATKRRVAGDRSSAQITAAVAGRATIATAVLTSAEGSGAPLARCEDATRPRCRHTQPYTHAMAVYSDLVRYRELFANLFRRDFHAKYRGSALGILWSLVNPAALVAVYLIVFGVILDKSGGIPHYPLYLLSGIACWIFFAVSLQTAARSMVESADLIRKVRFPRQLV